MSNMLQTVRVGVNARVYFDLRVKSTSDAEINRALNELNGIVPPSHEVGDISSPTHAFLVEEEREIPEPPAEGGG